MGIKTECACEDIRTFLSHRPHPIPCPTLFHPEGTHPRPIHPGFHPCDLRVMHHWPGYSVLVTRKIQCLSLSGTSKGLC